MRRVAGGVIALLEDSLIGFESGVVVTASPNVHRSFGGGRIHMLRTLVVDHDLEIERTKCNKYKSRSTVTRYSDSLSMYVTQKRLNCLSMR